MDQLSWLRRTLIIIVAACLLAVGGTVASSPPQARANPVTDAACAVANVAITNSCDAVKGTGDAAKTVVKDAASDGFKGIVKSILQGSGTAMVTVLTWFVKIPTPQAAEYSAISKVKELTLRLQLIFMAVSIIVGGIRLMLAKRHAVYAAGEEQFQAMGRAVIGAWMFGGFLTALSLGTDALAVAWLDSVTKGTGPAKVVERIVNVNVLMGMGSGLVLIVGILGVLGAVFQAIVLVVRQAMLILVTAYIPIMGAASGTELGKAAYSKTVRWVIALLLWKLVAASCFVVAFELAGSNSSDKADQMQVFYGFILLFLSALVLPMLMKLVSAGLSMSGGSGLQAGMMVAGAVAAGGTLAAGGAGGGGAASTASQSGATSGQGPSGGESAGGGEGAGGGVSRPSGGGSSEGAGSAPSAGGSPGGGRAPSSGGTSGGGGGSGSGGGGASSNVPSSAAMPTTDSSSQGGGSASSGGGGNRFSAATDAMAATNVMSQAAQSFFDGGDDGAGADGGPR